MGTQPAPSPVLFKLGAGIRELLDSPEGAELPIEMRELLVKLDEALSARMGPSQPSAKRPPESEQR
jgi:hypothetical protein